MTVSSATSKVVGSGNGVTTLWPFAFKVFQPGDLEVVYTDAAGIETGLAPGDYVVQLNASQSTSPGGSVVYPASGTPIAAGTRLTIRRVLPLTQPTDLKNQGGFYPEIVETALDRLGMQVQQTDERGARALYTPASDPPPASLPAAARRAGKVLGFDEDGNPVVSMVTVEDLDTLVDAADEAAASAAAAASSATAAASSATSAASSASAAQTAVNSIIFQDVVFRVAADSPITIADADSGKLFVIDCTSGAVTVNLPSIAGLTLSLPWTVAIKKTDSSGNAVTINRNGTDTIDGSTSYTLTVAEDGVVLVPDTDASPDDWTPMRFGPTAIANDSVDNSKLANMAAGTYKMRVTASTGDPEDATAAQATAGLNAMVGDSGSGGTKGLVPAPGAGDAAAGKFLKADGTFAVPGASVSAASQAEQEAGSSTTVYTTPGRQQFHPSACKAWSKFDATGTQQANYNVASITDVGTGRWTVNVGTDFSSGNYSAGASSDSGVSSNHSARIAATLAAGTYDVIAVNGAGSLTDPTSGNIFTWAFGDQ